MYRAKQNGGGRFEIFDRHLAVNMTSQQARERELRGVLGKREYEIWYQPIFRLDGGKIEAFESLLRWRRPDDSVDDFRDLLAVAEDSGLSITLGRELLEKVCRQLRNWTDIQAKMDMMLTVNVTRRQFYHPNMVAQLSKILTVSGVDPSRLLLEVPETTLNENPDAAVSILQRMADCNVRLAVDHFGSSLAPINHLVRLPLDVVKLDSRLTQTAIVGGRQGAILESLVHLGRSLGLQVVAQGIETPEQRDALRRLGCELGQGSLLSDAMEAERVQQFVERRSRAI
jgi:EAL domain-containing protein (putative c-di-GMP-specific phosphodiesterase class I)